jgi:hypothetical protein
MLSFPSVLFKFFYHTPVQRVIETCNESLKTFQTMKILEKLEKCRAVFNYFFGFYRIPLKFLAVSCLKNCKQNRNIKEMLQTMG